MYQMDIRTKELANDVLKKYPETFAELQGVKIAFLSSTEKKKAHGGMVYADCQVLNPKMRTISGYAFVITVYEPNIAFLDPEQQELVMWHELHHARVTGEDEYSIRPHDLEDFRELIEAKGIDYNKPHKKDEAQAKSEDEDIKGQTSVDDYIQDLRIDKSEAAEEGKENA